MLPKGYIKQSLIRHLCIIPTALNANYTLSLKRELQQYSLLIGIQFPVFRSVATQHHVHPCYFVVKNLHKFLTHIHGNTTAILRNHFAHDPNQR